VAAVAILVVNKLIGSKFAAEMSFHDKTMLILLSLWIPEVTVPEPQLVQ
jgi:hypothetical protein